MSKNFFQKSKVTVSVTKRASKVAKQIHFQQLDARNDLKNLSVFYLAKQVGGGFGTGGFGGFGGKQRARVDVWYNT